MPAGESRRAFSIGFAEGHEGAEPLAFLSFRVFRGSMSTGRAVCAACLLEVTARKVGNVHPLAAFSDCDWETFAASAEAIAPVLEHASSWPLGETILEAVEATQDLVGRNTNLGMILLLAPLAAVPADAELSAGVSRVLDCTTVEDCHLVYEAIRAARPGGLGSAERQDVAAPPTVALFEAMRLAADRDAVARQYATGFADVFSFATRFSAHDLPALEHEIVSVHLEMVAAGLETLIARKCGMEVAAEAARRAGEADGAARPALAEFDSWLRGDGNRRNPGTTADLIAAALFVAIREGRIPCFDAAEIVRYAEEIRRDGQPLPEFPPR